MLRAIELNGVAVQNNLLAFSLGRLAAADPAACDALRSGAADAGQRVASGESLSDVETVEALIAARRRALERLSGCRLCAALCGPGAPRARRRRRLLGADASLPFTRTVAKSLLKLMAYKDEYEVARLYTDGRSFSRS